MKSSKGESVSAMRQELSHEKQQGQHRFEAIISRVYPGHAVSTTVPFYWDHDFDFREFGSAEKVVLEQVREGNHRKFHELEGASAACRRSTGFLSTAQELANEALEKGQAPVSLCYIFNSNQYTMTLDAARPVPEKVVHFVLSDTKRNVERTYHDLEEARFHVANHSTGKETYFALLLGTRGSLRGVPVQIRYQPNWWFRITLNLKPPDEKPASGR
jgi:hypothetical protein